MGNRRNAMLGDGDVVAMTEGLLADGPVRKNQAQRANARAEVRVTYILPLGVREGMKAVARARGLPLKEVARWALEDFLRRLEAGEIELVTRVRPGGLTIF